MKLQPFLPLLAAAIGFAVAWAVKPAPQTATSRASDEKSAASQKNPRDPRQASRSSGNRKPREVHATDFPLADAAEKGPQTALEGKLGRLSEALGLSVEQQAAIVAAIDTARAATSADLPVIEDMTARGSAVEDKLRALLSPEQFAKFLELRDRERDNLIESRAQKLLSPVLDRVDLSPTQRDDILARLRLHQREEIQEVPAAATLLLGSSILPTDPKDPGIDGLLVMRDMENSGVNPAATAQEAHDRMILRQKEALERKLECFDGILTSGQMGQYQAFLAEQQRLIDEMRRRAGQQAAERARKTIEAQFAEDLESEEGELIPGLPAPFAPDEEVE